MTSEENENNIENESKEKDINEEENFDGNNNINENNIYEEKEIKENDNEDIKNNDNIIKEGSIQEESNEIKEKSEDNIQNENNDNEEKEIIKINEESKEINKINENNENKIQIESNQSEDMKDNNKLIQNDRLDKFSNIPIYIYSVKKIEINSVPVLIYIIRGKLIHKEIIRTFNDFEIFHQSLLKAWPCISIPGLSFKQTMSVPNSTTRFSEMKTKLLNHFFKKISESKELLNCEETKTFLSQDKNFNIKLSDMKKDYSFKEISEKYFKTFTDFIEDKNITDEKESFIKKNIKLLEITYKKLINVGKTIENEIYNINKEQSSLDFITNMLLDLEKSLPNSKKCFSDVKNVVKPLKSVSILIK